MEIHLRAWGKFGVSTIEFSSDLETNDSDLKGCYNSLYEIF
jgi:hypothetical protein